MNFLVRSKFRYFVILSALGLVFAASKTIAAPLTTQPNAVGMVLSPCSSNVPLVGGGSGDPTACWTAQTFSNGTYIYTLPSATDTIATLAATQTLTNKTLTSSTNVLGGVTAGFGSDAKGDIYINSGSSNVIERLGIGSAGNVLTVSSGLPAWESASSNFVTSFSAGTTGLTPSSATEGAVTLAGTLVVANGGTNCASASITCFNNITGLSAAGTTGTTTTNLVFSSSPMLTTPTLGAATATSITFSPTTDGIVGTTTNDGAAAGYVGEYVVSGASSFNNTIISAATVTISIASPAVISWTGNPYYLSTATGNGCASLVVFSTTGALPTGLTAGTNYYVTCNANFTANAFNVSTSTTNAIAGTAINTSGSQSGTQSAVPAYSIGSGSGRDFGAMSLTAGDWDVTGIIHIVPASTTSFTQEIAVISSTTGGGGTVYAVATQSQAAEVPVNSLNIPLSVERISLASTTTVFCAVDLTFTVSTATVSGECRARRVR